MTAATAPVRARPRPAARAPGRAGARLLLLELRHSPMPWLLPLVAALFWATTYRKVMAQPPQWYPRAGTIQIGALLAFASPVTGAAAWTAARDRRRHISDLVAVTARPRWTRLLAPWAATAAWAVAGFVACIGVLYGVTARQASWGGPLWWPVVLDVAAILALSAAGFTAGTLVASRYTAPVVTLGTFLALGFSTQPIVGAGSYWDISPIVAGSWDFGQRRGGHLLPLSPGPAHSPGDVPGRPDLGGGSGLWVCPPAPAGDGCAPSNGGRSRRRSCWRRHGGGLAGTGRMDAHGMIAVPALHDAASDVPVHYTAVCSHAAVPVCLNPAYAGYLPARRPRCGRCSARSRACRARRPGSARPPPTYRQGAGNEVAIGLDGPVLTGTPPVYRLVLPDQLSEPALTTQQWAAPLRISDGSAIVASVTGAGPGASPAQDAVATAIMLAAGVRLAPPPGSAPVSGRAPGAGGCPRQRIPARRGETLSGSGPGPIGVSAVPPLAAGSPGYAAAQRFAAQPAAVRHAWLIRHLAALRAGRSPWRSCHDRGRAKGGAAEWTEELGARNERAATREAGGYSPPAAQR